MNDASSAYGASRRVLRNTLALVGSFYLISPHLAWAASEIDNALRERFMRLSRFLVNHQLDALIDELPRPTTQSYLFHNDHIKTPVR